MLNTEIKYKTSTDYNQLYRLLKEGNIIIGYIAIDIGGVPSMEYSKLIQMSYNEKFKSLNSWNKKIWEILLLNVCYLVIKVKTSGLLKDSCDNDRSS